MLRAVLCSLLLCTLYLSLHTQANSLNGTFCSFHDWNATISANVLATLMEPANPQLLPYVGNGYLATTIASDTIYVGGVYNGQAPSGPSRRARIPSTVSVNIINENATQCGSALDVQKAIYSRRFLVGDALIAQTWFAHRIRRNVLILSIENLTPDIEVTLELSVNYGPPSSDIGFAVVEQELMPVCNLTEGRIFAPEMEFGYLMQVGVCASFIPQQLVLGGTAKKREMFATVIYTSEETDDPATAAMLEFLQVTSVHSYESLLKSHETEWAHLWTSGMDVSDNLALARMINSSMYYILSSTRTDWIYGISPGGLSTNDYNGHVFWDMDTWMMPFLLMFHPPIATSLLNYRIQRLGAAQQKAAFYGYQGAFYPWESAFSGVECTPPPNQEGELEIHINGDVAHAFKLHWLAVQDFYYMANEAWPVLQNVAMFWASRVTLGDDGLYGFLDVQPPDEHAGRVNNSIYTNAIAKSSLEFTVAIAQVLHIPVPSLWSHIAANMKMPFNTTLQIHEEYEGYAGQTINQDDVGLLQYPLNVKMSKQIAYNDLAYYQAHTDSNGYFTGDSAYSIAWLGLGQLDEAEAQFNNSFLHMAPPFNVWMERAYTGGNLNFITGAGGFLQNIMFGYGGMRITDAGLKLNPTLVPHTTETTLRGIQYRGYLLHVKFNAVNMTIWSDEPTLLAIATDDGNSTQAVIGLVSPKKVTLRNQPLLILIPNVSPLIPAIVGTLVALMLGTLVYIGITVRMASMKQLGPGETVPLVKGINAATG